MREVGDAERRARLGRRHHLTPGERAASVEEATAALVGLHATDPATVHLSARARVGGMTVADMERALYADRTLVKQLAMRRTLFVLPRGSLPAALAGVGRRVAEAESRRLVRDVERAGLQADGARWLRRAQRAVRAALAGGREATSAELRAEIPALAGAIAYGEGRPWAAEVPVGPRVLTTLSAAGEIVRASNDGAWTASRPRWAAMETWLGEPLATLPARAGTARLVEGYLRAFGPATEGDVRWWLGSTLTAVRRALADLDAVEVAVDGGTGYLLPDDIEPVSAPEPWAALLPALDPTTMGWYERDWYLGPHRDRLFDANGNAGATAWWDGLIVGGWRQRPDGAVELQLLEDPGADGRAALEREAAALSAWLDGTRVLARFPSPLSRAAA